MKVDLIPNQIHNSCAPAQRTSELNDQTHISSSSTNVSLIQLSFSFASVLNDNFLDFFLLLCCVVILNCIPVIMPKEYRFKGDVFTEALMGEKKVSVIPGVGKTYGDLLTARGIELVSYLVL